MGVRRESADMHFWVTDEAGERKLGARDKIRAELAGVQYQNSVGELAHPFASKIVHRIGEARLKYTLFHSRTAPRAISV